MKFIYLLIAFITVGHAVADTSGPTVSQASPANLSAGLHGNQGVSFLLLDVDGIDASTISLSIRGNTVAHHFDATAGLVSWSPTTPLTDGATAVSVSAADTQGNQSTVSWTYSISNAYLLHASESGDEVESIAIEAGDVTINGNVFGGSDISFSGGFCQVTGTVRAACHLHSAGNNTLATVDVEVVPTPAPKVDLAALQAAAVATHATSIEVTETFVLAEGIHYVQGDLVISAPIANPVTIVATGKIVVDTDLLNLTSADAGGVLFHAGTHIQINGPQSSFTGSMYAPNGIVSIDGSENTFKSGATASGIWAKRIVVSGSDAVFGSP